MRVMCGSCLGGMNMTGGMWTVTTGDPTTAIPLPVTRQ